MNEDAFNPEDFGFFLRKEKLYPPEVRFFEKDHESIDKAKEKDWKRLNLFLSIDGSFVTIWYGAIDPILAESEYSKEFNNLPWKDYDPDEQLFRGYITNKQEAEIILNAIRYMKYKPQYLGRG